MRKILFLTCFLAGMLVACDSDDEVIMIQPIDLTDSPVEVFFNSELLESEKFFFNNPFSPGGDDNIVYAINSRQELEDIYSGEKDLPMIDFKKYTLIIGQLIMPCPGYYVVQKELTAGDNDFILNMHTKNNSQKGGMHETQVQFLYFWEIYPKQAQKEFCVNVFEQFLDTSESLLVSFKGIHF